MRAAWYEKQGPASDVLVLGDMPDPQPGPGEVRIRVAACGINPGEIKKRQNTFGTGMPYPRVIPHSDAAGTVDLVGENVSPGRMNERVWCYGAQSYRPFGAAAQFVIVPTEQAVPLPDGVSFEQGACLGIPGITAHRAVHAAGPIEERTVLVQGGAGAVGSCAVALACHAQARVIATVRSEADKDVATKSGAHAVVRTDRLSPDEVVERLQTLAPTGVDHIVEVAFDANIAADTELLKLNGSIAAYATREFSPQIPFWPLVFKNIRVYFLGSDDFPSEAKQAAAKALNDALTSQWSGFDIGDRFPLSEIVAAHECVEQRKVAGRVILVV